MARFVIAEAMRQQTANGQYPDDSRACDLCAGLEGATEVQVCDHRCVCGRQLACRGHHGRVSAEVWKGLALAAADSALYAIQRGSADEAADYARQCVTACRKHQLAGGQPWDR